MESLKGKMFSLVAAFIFGGVTTYFVTDYIRLKSNEIVTENKSTSKQKITQSNMIKKDDQSDRDAFTQMDKIHQQMKKKMDQAFGKSMFGGSLFDDHFFGNPIKGMSSGGLQVEKREDDHYKYIEVIANGIDKNSININIADGMISIAGEIRKKNNQLGGSGQSVSSYISSFNQSFNIPQGVNPDKAEIDALDDKIVIKFPKFKV